MSNHTLQNKTHEATLISPIPQTYLEAQAIALLLYARKDPVFKRALVKMTADLHPLTNGRPRFAVTNSVWLLMPEEHNAATRRAAMLMDVCCDKTLAGSGSAIEVLASVSREG